MSLMRFCSDAAVRRDQRKFAVERFLGGEQDAQRRALPGRERRGEHGEFGGILELAVAVAALAFPLLREQTMRLRAAAMLLQQQTRLTETFSPPPVNVGSTIE